MNRKDVLQWLAAGAGFAAGAALTYRLMTERSRLTVTRATFGIRNLPPDLEGLRVGHLTDLHVGPGTPAEFVREAISMANRLQPHVVLMTGDFVDYRASDLPACAEALSRLRAPLGAYGVLGNHDHAVGADEVEQALTHARVRVLRNSNAPLGNGPRHLWIAGLDDTTGYRGDFCGALAGIPPGDPIILLSHVPDVLPKAADEQIDLILAGHTHGGQVVLPLIGAPHAPVRLGGAFISGSRRINHSRVHTSRGVGTSVLPVRFRCPPEIGLFTLRAAGRTD
jgi:predicted MPP superfamily phosphohydrolase